MSYVLVSEYPNEHTGATEYVFYCETVDFAMEMHERLTSMGFNCIPSRDNVQLYRTRYLRVISFDPHDLLLIKLAV
jgi:hypothetical protein